MQSEYHIIFNIILLWIGTIKYSFATRAFQGTKKWYWSPWAIGMLSSDELQKKKEIEEKNIKQLVICNQYLDGNRIPCNYYCVLSRASKYKSRYGSRVFLFTTRSNTTGHRLTYPSLYTLSSRDTRISIVIPTAHRDGKRSPIPID